MMNKNNFYKECLQDVVEQMSEGYFMFDSLQAKTSIEKKAFVKFADIVSGYFPIKKSFSRPTRFNIRVDTRGLNNIETAIKRGIAAIPKIEVSYGHLIQQQADRHGIDPLLVLATIAIESEGDRKALSDSGAIGLMQIMPGTALYMGYRARDLVKPYVNIEIGCKYHAESQDRFNGNEAVMMVAYNAGNQGWSGIDREVRKYGSIEKVPYFQKVNGVLRYLRARDKAITLVEGDPFTDMLED